MGALSKPLEAEAATASRDIATLRVQAKVAVHTVEQGGIDMGLGSIFRRVRFAAGPDSRPRLQHCSGSLDAGARLRHKHLRQALAGARCILQFTEQPRDVGDLLVDMSPSSRTPGALFSTTGRRLSVIEARALELMVDPEIDDFCSHEICIPCESQIVLLFNETRGGSGRPDWPGVAVAFL